MKKLETANRIVGLSSHLRWSATAYYLPHQGVVTVNAYHKYRGSVQISDHSEHLPQAYSSRQALSLLCEWISLLILYTSVKYSLYLVQNGHIHVINHEERDISKLPICTNGKR